ncbi:ATP-grasp domain-containing protein [Virgibacillus sp. DJP39]|uniref:ATP-grasp domain-containing protein n=1 Tax=Virgibacillus sp. DJP39 TaxID=3409790 RepID=UPI003BB56775
MSKNILFFNATYIKKEKTLSTAKDLGLIVYVVGPTLPQWSYPYVDGFIESNTYDISETLPKLKKRHQEHPFDGVITFWDRDVLPVAETAQELGLHGSPVHSAKMARHKLTMRKALEANNVPHPRFMSVKGYEDLLKAKRKLQFPLIIKPVGASASKGVFKIDSEKEIEQIYRTMNAHLTEKNDKMFSFHHSEYIIEEYMDGQEVSIEGIVSKGKVFIAGITEKEIDNYFEEYLHAFPARLPSNLKNEIIKITNEAINAMGLDNCGFHAEVMITNDGCKIVEVNGRIGGDFITTHLVPVSSGIDLTKNTLLASLGEPINFSPDRSKGSCVKFLIAKNEGVIQEWRGDKNIHEMPGVVNFTIEKERGESVLLPPNKFHDSRIAYVITEGKDTNQAIKRANQALEGVECIIISDEKTLVSHMETTEFSS